MQGKIGLETFHEEADGIMVQQMARLLNLGSEVFQLGLMIQMFSSYYCIIMQTFTSHATLQ